MPWKLMIDDKRDPENVHANIRPDAIYLEPGWKVAQTVEAAIALIEAHGYPEFISFDHDLGTDVATGQELKSGKDFANYLVQRDMDVADMPADFRYVVHSMNGWGNANIYGLLDDYLAKRTPGVPVPRLW